jgi:hypothetical protein
MHPFDYAKHKLLDSSKKLYQFQLWNVLFGILLAIIVIIAIVVFLIPVGFDVNNFDPTDIYGLRDTFLGIGIGLLVSGLIILIAFAITGIMIFIQYYRLGSGYSLLAKADPISDSAKNASYGFHGYIIATIIGIFVPGYGGLVVSILGTLALTLGFYFIYRSFVDYQNQRRFPKSPSFLLLIAGVLTLATDITSFFTPYGSLISILIPILLIFGFRGLVRELTLIQPPTGGSVKDQSVQSQTPIESVAAQTETSPPTEGQFCSSCGAKAQPGSKFCENCGANI